VLLYVHRFVFSFIGKYTNHIYHTHSIQIIKHARARLQVRKEQLRHQTMRFEFEMLQVKMHRESQEKNLEYMAAFEVCAGLFVGGGERRVTQSEAERARWREWG
jgi:hypothetical protein